MERHCNRKRYGLLIAAVTLISCATTQYGATDANLAQAKSAAPDGARLFSEQCAVCHGARGAGAKGAPHILGPGALPEYPRARDVNADPATGDPEFLRLQAQSRPEGAPWRDPFRSAQDLYNYVSKHMPLPQKKAGTLSSEEYWAIINFMLRAHGAQLPPEGVTPANARSVKL